MNGKFSNNTIKFNVNFSQANIHEIFSLRKQKNTRYILLKLGINNCSQNNLGIEK